MTDSPTSLPIVHPDPRELLTRDEFRKAVFARDHNKCVVCGAPAEDAHHIIERRLWADGGYYLDNGASLCDQDGQGCHALAETTELSADYLRGLAGITRALVPLWFATDDPIDKWGNVVTADGRVHPGPLFYEPSVQRHLAASGKLQNASSRIKHPRTPHLPWSPGRSKDDVAVADLSVFYGQEVVVTSKMDGESTTIGRDNAGGYTHARSLDSGPHPSRTWVRRLAGPIAGELPLGWRVVGENLQAAHSVTYQNLPGYFLVFAIASDEGEYLSFDETADYTALLDLPMVPVLYRGPYDEALIRACWPGRDPYTDEQEGYVLRLASRVPVSEFGKSFAKFVRANHVTTDSHWRFRPIRPNGLATPEVEPLTKD
jgi:hypothetical protein